MSIPDIPLAYRDGVEKARRLDPALAQAYARHTRIGDPEADAVMAALAGHPSRQVQDWIRRVLDHGPASVPDAPAALRQFVAGIEAPPDWFEAERTLAGCRAFHRHSELLVGAFVGAVLIEGFSTLISQSFCVTGRLVDQGVIRLKQNNRHLVEIFIPGGLERDGDGWKLSVRIRLMHARVRLLLAASDDWNEAELGTPLSSAHIAFATACFSGLLLKRAAMLGVTLDAEERDSFMLVWRYAGRLMGVHPELAFDDEAGALHLQRVGALCEPPPTDESIILANCLINSAPVVAGITEPAARDRLTRRIYRVSRALIGDELADALNYPPMASFGALTALRWKTRAERLAGRLFPAFEQSRRASQFQRMLEVSFHSDQGMAYRLPEHVHAERDVAS